MIWPQHQQYSSGCPIYGAHLNVCSPICPGDHQFLPVTALPLPSLLPVPCHCVHIVCLAWYRITYNVWNRNNCVFSHVSERTVCLMVFLLSNFLLIIAIFVGMCPLVRKASFANTINDSLPTLTPSPFPMHSSAIYMASTCCYLKYIVGPLLFGTDGHAMISFNRVLYVLLSVSAAHALSRR